MSEFTDNEYCLVKKHRNKRRGEDGYKYISIRVQEEIAESLEEISIKTDQSRNAIINLFLIYGIQHCKIEES